MTEESFMPTWFLVMEALGFQSGALKIVTSQPAISAAEMDNQIKAFSQKLSGHLEKIMDTTEQGIRDMTGALPTGNIKLNNRNDEIKIIQLFILIEELKTTGSQQLFKNIASTDIAYILNLHFEAFKDKRPNTIQKKINEQTELLHTTNSQKVKNLEAALQEFFS